MDNFEVMHNLLQVIHKLYTGGDLMIKDKTKRTSAEWEAIYGIRVLHPYGWFVSHGRLRPKVMHKKISRREFYLRTKQSVIELKE